jgi:hypothetical protein
MADQLSLAAIAFHMPTGQAPFDSWDGVLELTRRPEGKGPAAVHKANPELPPEVSEKLRRGLARLPWKCFGSRGKFVSAAELALHRKTPSR